MCSFAHHLIRCVGLQTGLTAISVSLGRPKLVRFTEISEINKLNDDEYGLPTISNFLVVDAVLQPDTLLQFTVAEKQIANLVLIRQQLKGPPCDHKLIFVLPKTLQRNFSHQPSYDASLPQFCCFSDVFIEGMAICSCFLMYSNCAIAFRGIICRCQDSRLSSAFCGV